LRLLLDTHALIRALAEPARLSAATRAALTDPANAVFVSAASAWEIAIKASLGRLDFPLHAWEEALAAAGFAELAVRAPHAIAAGGLPRHHADPFDRMLVAQARHEGLTLVTQDAALAAYGVALLPP
jgi:PIN domain nuclease of toxin-antitoxin system